jgi:hypothetical protein
MNSSIIRIGDHHAFRADDILSIQNIHIVETNQCAVEVCVRGIPTPDQIPFGDAEDDAAEAAADAAFVKAVDEWEIATAPLYTTTAEITAQPA